MNSKISKIALLLFIIVLSSIYTPVSNAQLINTITRDYPDFQFLIGSWDQTYSITPMQGDELSSKGEMTVKTSLNDQVIEMNMILKDADNVYEKKFILGNDFLSNKLYFIPFDSFRTTPFTLLGEYNQNLKSYIFSGTRTNARNETTNLKVILKIEREDKFIITFFETNAMKQTKKILEIGNFKKEEKSKKTKKK